MIDLESNRVMQSSRSGAVPVQAQRRWQSARWIALGLVTAFMVCTGAFWYLLAEARHRKADFVSHAVQVVGTYVSGCGDELRVRFSPPGSDPTEQKVTSELSCPAPKSERGSTYRLLVDRENPFDVHLDESRFFLSRWERSLYTASLLSATGIGIVLLAGAILATVESVGRVINRGHQTGSPPTS